MDDSIAALPPSDFKQEDVQAYQGLVARYGAFSPAALEQQIMQAKLLILCKSGDLVIAGIAIRRPPQEYRRYLEDSTGVDLPADQYPYELGWLAVHERRRAEGWGRRLVDLGARALRGAGAFATTASDHPDTRRLVETNGFIRAGRD